MPVSRTFDGLFGHLISAFVITLFCLHPVWADDTEIFFSPVTGSDAQPNILFVIDASASMNFYDCDTGRRQRWTACGDGTEFGDTTRLQRMNNAMANIINNVSDVNIGVVRFSNLYSGGRVIYPVRDIDQRLCDGSPCENDSNFEGTITNVRQEILDVMNSMVMQWTTPTIGGLLESAYYFMGDPVDYGKKRWFHPGSNNEQGENSRVSHPDSYEGDYQLVREEGCTDSDLSAEECSSEEITGNPVYISPIKNECQSNHIILVTDGEGAVEANEVRIVEDMTGTACEAMSRNKGTCAVELAEYLYQTDLHTDIPGDQNIITHTVGFNLQSDWLENIAAAGGGHYKTAESSDDLINVVTEIINSVETVNTTFVAPGATVDLFSRLSHRNDLYLSLFKPSESPGWAGNLKRFDMKGSPPVLYDASEPQAVAIDPDTGLFYATSKSFWSAAVDGHDIALGGAASKLNHLTRNVVTYSGAGEKRLLHNDNKLDFNNTLLDYNRSPVSTNLAPTGWASQSSTRFSGSAGRAIDNNTEGKYRSRSVTHTSSSVRPWWQVALPEATDIERITIHNRTDACCTQRLSDMHVFVSENPFDGATVEELQARSDVWHRYLDGEQAEITELVVNSRGRYVRVQLGETPDSIGTLSLAEVKVYGGDLAEEWEKKGNILDWVRGVDVKDDDEDGDTTDNRHHMGDPLHATPVTVTYGGDASDPESVVFVGTNEGFLHAINTNDGTENFAFMPEVLIENLPTLYDNITTGRRVYGMDGELSTWIDDQNDDGLINANLGEKAYLYSGMRRGGSQYFALDVSSKTDPKFLFSIPDSDPGKFNELGQTWSKLVPTRINYLGTNTDVLIFGGGYDSDQDNQGTRTTDTIGRAIYIVDAETGKLLWSGGPANGTETQSFDDMTFSFPATPNVVDTNGDGLVEQIYIGDIGGRIWRFDINETATSSNNLVDGGIIADLSSDGTYSDNRRFFHGVDVSLSRIGSELFANIAVGSGFQAHPLDTATDDRFYLIRYPVNAQYDEYGQPLYGIPEDKKDDDDNTYYTPIVNADLFDATSNIIGEGDAAESVAAEEDLALSSGWFIDMELPGEKVLGTSITFNDAVYFASYVPDQAPSGCAPAIGHGVFWAVDLWDATPVSALADDDSDDERALVKADRTKQIPGGAIPAPIQVLLIQSNADSEDESLLHVQVKSGANTLLDLDSDELNQRVYWSEYPNF